MELITIPFSHYNERARWALDYHGFQYREHRYLPMLHFYGVLKHAGRGTADKTSTALSTPVLVDETVRLNDSGQIIEFAEKGSKNAAATLYPKGAEDQIREWERRAHDELGVDTRRCAYWFALREPELFIELAQNNVDPEQARWVRTLAPIITLAIQKTLKIDERRFLRSAERLETFFDAVADELDGRDFLFEDRLTAADLTIAALAAPVLLPLPNYGAWVEASPQAPEAQQFLTRFKESRTGRYVQKLYESCRRSINAF